MPGVTEAELLRRIDRHLAEVSEEVRLTREFMAEQRLRSNEFMREERLRSNEFMREERLRSDRRYEQTIRRLDRTIEDNSRAWREGIAEIRELREEFREETRAQRAALFRMMDRLGPGPGDAPATA
jgi:hypothetical protein